MLAVSGALNFLVWVLVIVILAGIALAIWNRVK